MYTTGEFAKLLGVSIKTLQRWDREGILTAHRSPTNRRMYTFEQLREVLGEKRNRKTIVYCRVSSPAQRPELENQVEAMKQYCIAAGIEFDEVVSEIGGGMNFKRTKFRRLLLSVRSGDIKTIVVAHKDRLARFGFDLVEYVCEINGCQIVVANDERLSPQEEMVQDLLVIVNTFSCRLYGLRNYKKKLQQALRDDISSQNQAEAKSNAA